MRIMISIFHAHNSTPDHQWFPVARVGPTALRPPEALAFFRRPAVNFVFLRYAKVWFGEEIQARRLRHQRKNWL